MYVWRRRDRLLGAATTEKQLHPPLEAWSKGRLEHTPRRRKGCQLISGMAWAGLGPDFQSRSLSCSALLGYFQIYHPSIVNPSAPWSLTGPTMARPISGRETKGRLFRFMCPCPSGYELCPMARRCGVGSGMRRMDTDSGCQYHHRQESWNASFCLPFSPTARATTS